MQYKTKQRELIIEFLRSSTDGHVTVNDVCGFLRDENHSVGQATVYRQLEKMVDEGIVTKYIIDQGSPACFEYAANSHVHGTCFHAKCDKCGKLFHISCDELEQLGEHLEEHHGFRINPLRTVFYGTCSSCRELCE
ncbi:MAG: transcriptional repressor [Oscillospiraceae bacterium]|nr:transcriptional repressor [Oscillospiraceae bacterium]